MYIYNTHFVLEFNSVFLDYETYHFITLLHRLFSFEEKSFRFKGVTAAYIQICVSSLRVHKR